MVLSAIDEIPVLAVAAAFADGTTEISEAGELRVKESDRIATTVSELAAIGVSISEREDGMTIDGGGVRGGDAQSFGDHRLAMALAAAALAGSRRRTDRGSGSGVRVVSGVLGPPTAVIGVSGSDRSDERTSAARAPLLVVLSGPSGAGKDAVLDEIERRGPALSSRHYLHDASAARGRAERRRLLLRNG